jgi:hypothetical protein
MKKLSVLLLSLALVLLLAACVSNQPKPASVNVIVSDTDLASADISGVYDNATVELGAFYTSDTDYSHKGEIITFGEYEGEPLSWQVISAENGGMLVITKDCITRLPYNEEYVAVTWETSSLRQWLNDEFYALSFSEEEKERIVLTAVTTPNNEQYGTSGGNETSDYVFLLSQDEVDEYLPRKTSRATKYPDGKQASWWLRSPGGNALRAGFIGGTGSVGVGYYVDYADNGVRPAIWITE